MALAVKTISNDAHHIFDTEINQAFSSRKLNILRRTKQRIDFLITAENTENFHYLIQRKIRASSSFPGVLQ